MGNKLPWSDSNTCSLKAIHTDVYLDRELHHFAEALNLPDICSFDELPHGCVLAIAELAECWKITDRGHTLGSQHAARIEGGKYGGKTNIVEGKEILFGDWTPGRYAWEFKNMMLLPKPIPAKGAQRLWNWDETPQWSPLIPGPSPD